MKSKESEWVATTTVKHDYRKIKVQFNSFELISFLILFVFIEHSINKEYYVILHTWSEASIFELTDGADESQSNTLGCGCDELSIIAANELLAACESSVRETTFEPVDDTKGTMQICHGGWSGGRYFETILLM